MEIERKREKVEASFAYSSRHQAAADILAEFLLPELIVVVLEYIVPITGNAISSRHTFMRHGPHLPLLLCGKELWQLAHSGILRVSRYGDKRADISLDLKLAHSCGTFFFGLQNRTDRVLKISNNGSVVCTSATSNHSDCRAIWAADRDELFLLYDNPCPSIRILDSVTLDHKSAWTYEPASEGLWFDNALSVEKNTIFLCIRSEIWLLDRWNGGINQVYRLAHSALRRPLCIGECIYVSDNMQPGRLLVLAKQTGEQLTDLAVGINIADLCFGGNYLYGVDDTGCVVTIE